MVILPPSLALCIGYPLQINLSTVGVVYVPWQEIIQVLVLHNDHKSGAPSEDQNLYRSKKFSFQWQEILQGLVLFA